MSLTSYLAAPPRDCCLFGAPSGIYGGGFVSSYWREKSLIRFGGYLLSHVLRRSTIGVEALNGRVRDGIGCLATTMTTKPEQRLAKHASRTSMYCSSRTTFGACIWLSVGMRGRCLAFTGSNQANRAISTSQLNALPHLHLWPIDVVVYHGPQGRPSFEGGFTLRCLQRLSCPNIATQHYRWHDNWSTSGSFNPVLSY